MDFWISFAPPAPARNLGVVITDAESKEAALVKVTNAGLNPGGEAAIWKLFKGDADKLGRDRLISIEELEKAGYVSSRHVPETREQFLRSASVVCERCNTKHRN